MPVNQQQNIRVLTVNAMFIALIATLGLAFGFVPLFFGLFSITILHIPVLVGAALLNVRSAIIFGLTFGVISWIVSLTSPLVGPADLIFNNPLISIFPRILFGLSAGMLFSIGNKLKGSLRYVGYGLLALVATLLHTIFVLIMIWIFESANLIASFNNLFQFIWIVISANGIIEAGVAAVLVPILVVALKQVPIVKQLQKNFQ
jgi:uncharacterized membrane protein